METFLVVDDYDVVSTGSAQQLPAGRALHITRRRSVQVRTALVPTEEGD
ncbi:hypothetical protein [Kitasatospora sp. NPDC058190]